MTSPPTPDPRLLRIHADVDRLARRLEARHRERLECRRGCSDCCVDGLTVSRPEAERIRARHGALLARERPHPEGKCAFLDAEGSCRIYEDRPYVCRTQGLPLRWYDPAPGGGVVEYRDICPLNETEQSLEDLPPEDFWLLGPVEARLAELGGSKERIALRDLFRTPRRGSEGPTADPR